MSFHRPSLASAPSPFALVNTSTRYGCAQPVSVAMHALFFFGLLYLFAAPHGGGRLLGPTSPEGPGHFILRYSPPPDWATGKASLGLHGGGSAEESAPARNGILPPLSSLPLAPPRLTHAENVALPVAPAVPDSRAPAVVPLVTDLGLPWMKLDTNSAGPGKGHGIGNTNGDGVGDDRGDGAGEGDDPSGLANVVASAACVYCPEPPYTDEARKAKLQGQVTLRVLVGADGRARQIRIVRGLGLGLDESALQTIRGWKFAPAKDARRQPVASWVTIETRFQLF
ncbi:MAG TPA: energy transducer TonB [Candidatus Eisenbacteria bacterium]|nr:energy transducer TonB [Candidatus Eisenbacteria bacterium]